MSNHFIIQLAESKHFEKPFSDDITDLNIGRIIGYLNAVNFIKMFNFLSGLPSGSLDANPRTAKESKITTEIAKTLADNPGLFHLKTKGLLISASRCELLDRERIRLHMYSNSQRDGILDGGHNTFAIGKFILEKIKGEELRKIKDIDSLVKVWSESADEISGFLNQEASELTFLIPVDIIFPVGIDDSDLLKDQWVNAHYEITRARNNNAQLKDSTRANHEGYYEDLKEILSPRFEPKIIWKTNDTDNGKRKIPVEDVLALALIPLSKIDPKMVGSMVKIYSSRGSCEKVFREILDEYGELDKQEGLKRITSVRLKSALSLVPTFLYAYDYLYEKFPEYYNKVGGSFGRITGVQIYDSKPKSNDEKNKKDKKRLIIQPITKYTESACDYKYSDAYIYPLLISLKELIQENRETGEFYLEQEVECFLANENNRTGLVTSLKSYMEAFQFYPDKIGKAGGIYETLSTLVKQSVEILQTK